MHPAEGRHQVIQEMTRATAQQRLHTTVRQGVTNISYTEEWCKECNSYPAAERTIPLHSVNLGLYHHKNVDGVHPKTSPFSTHYLI